MDFEADVDGWGQWQGEQRTPLMVAAAEGNLTLVKLFVDVFHSNDALVAPDGQMALRLAVEGDRKEIVAFLPARRGGGWRRWKVQHANAVKRARRAILEIFHFLKALVWEVPRFFVWTLPKEVVFRPIRKCVAWCWKNRQDFGPWCKRKVVELPDRTKKAAVELVKRTWRFVTESLPKLCKELNYPGPF